MKNGELIKRIIIGINDVESQYKERMVQLQKVLQTLKDFDGKESFTEEEVKQIMSITCFDHLAYCCNFERDCYKRDAALQTLKISPEHFKQKEAWLQEVLQKPKKKISEKEKEKIKKLDLKELKKQGAISEEKNGNLD